MAGPTSPLGRETASHVAAVKSALAAYDRWAVCLLAAASIASIYGVTYSFSVVLDAIAGTFQVTSTRSSLLFSTNTVVSYSVAAVVGFVADRQPASRLAAVSAGCWALGIAGTALADSYLAIFVAYGLVLAVGFGVCFINLYATVARRFTDRRGLALGIVSAGIGTGVLVGPPVANALLQAFDWRMVYVGLGVASVVVLSLTAVVLRLSRSEALVTNAGAGESRLSVTDILRSPPFWLLLTGFSLAFYTFYTLFIHLVPFAESVGISATVASTGLGIVGGVSILGRFGSGYLSDHVGRLPLLVAGAFVMAAIPVAVLTVDSGTLLLAIAVAFGYAYGTLGSLFSPMVADLFAAHSVGRMVGMTSISFALAGSVGPYLTGLLHEATGTYVVPFGVAAATAVVGAVFFVLSVRVVE